MRDRTKLVLTVAALALTVAAVPKAFAGNLNGDITNPAYCNFVQYYSVWIGLGQCVRYNGPALPAGSVWTVDDVSYAVELDPNFPAERSELFDDASVFVGDPAVDMPYSPIGPPGPMFSVSYGTGGTSGYLVRWARARGTLFQAGLNAGPFGDVGPGFDAIAHTCWGQILGREKVQYGNPFVGGEGSLDYSFAHSSIGFAAWATQSSESRHYQTPQLVLPDQWVNYGNDPRTIATGGLSTYINGRVALKGRILVAGTGSGVAPVTDASANMQILP